MRISTCDVQHAQMWTRVGRDALAFAAVHHIVRFLCRSRFQLKCFDLHLFPAWAFLRGQPGLRHWEVVAPSPASPKLAALATDLEVPACESQSRPI